MINTFPERLRAMREAKNLSRGDLAQLAALGEDALAHIERGSTRCSPEQLAAIAGALQVSADALLGLTEDTPEEGDTRADLRRLLRHTKHLSARELNLVAQVAEALAASKGA